MLLDGKIFSADRGDEKPMSVKGKQIDLWYSGKAHGHGGNVQAVFGPDGFPLWMADGDYDGAGIGVHIPPVFRNNFSPALSEPHGSGSALHVLPPAAGNAWPVSTPLEMRMTAVVA